MGLRLGLGLGRDGGPAAAPVAALLGTPVVAALGTTVTADLGADGITWASQDNLVMFDATHWLTVVQRLSNGQYFLYTNDAGATWTDSLQQGFLTRGALAWDGATTIHALWSADDAGDGIIYRRYTVAFDGAGAITSIARADAGTVNLQLDAGGGGYGHPHLLYEAGTLTAIWTAADAAALLYEIRASTRALSGDAADGVAGNWAAPGTPSTPIAGPSTPTVAYTALATCAASAGVTGTPGSACLRLGTGHLALVYAHKVDFTHTEWRYRRLDAGGVLQASATLLASDFSAGYAHKVELVSRLVARNDGSLAVAFPHWDAGGGGDTWAYTTLAADVAATPTALYAASGAHSYAPTGALAYDATADVLLHTWIVTTSQAARLQRAADAATTLDAGPVDIPCLATNTRVGGAATLIYRRTTGGAPPYAGYLARVPWV